MKVGDQKQAIALGVVAIFAVGMLGKTAFGAFGGGNSNQAPVIKDIGGGGERTTSVSQEPETGPAPSAMKDTAVEANAPAVDPTVVKRDAFDKPSLPEGTKPFASIKTPTRPSNETLTPTGEVPPATITGQVDSKPYDRLPDGKIASEPEKKPSEAPKDTRIAIRFDGYVEAGSPMAVVSVGGKSSSVAAGDELIQDFRVVSISTQRLTIRRGKVVKTILIGKEVKI